MSELIDRQEAIDRFNVIRPIDPKKDEYTKGIDVGIAMCIVAVKDQPNVQPEKAQLPQQDATSDLISRQAAIDALHTWFRDGFDEDKWWNSTHVLAAIEGLHPVQQEHKWETCFECPLSHGCPKIKGCTNEQAIEYASQIPNDCPLSAQPESCKGCIQYGLWENEIEYGLPSPCTRCKRRANDNYEGRFNQQTGSD